ncbi:hypothetical protein TNCV_3133411 [Trichonephila clavipes]|nr:hypothetical protein TNCV_3133411 [Trichonephila clavipes]
MLMEKSDGSANDLSPIENVWSMLAQRLAWYTPPAAISGQLWQHVEATWTAIHQGYIQSLFDSMLRRVAAVLANNGDYTTTDFVIIHPSQETSHDKQHIESVTHHSVSMRTIRRLLQQSGLYARAPLLGLPLTQNRRRLRRQY